MTCRCGAPIEVPGETVCDACLQRAYHHRLTVGALE